jgi:hypothetical protein
LLFLAVTHHPLFAGFLYILLAQSLADLISPLQFSPFLIGIGALLMYMLVGLSMQFSIYYMLGSGTRSVFGFISIWNMLICDFFHSKS